MSNIDYASLIQNEYKACPPISELPDFKAEVARSIDKFGRTSRTLAELWYGSAGIPLVLVPYLINRIGGLEASAPITLKEVGEYCKANAARYAYVDKLPGAIKNLSSLQNAANDYIYEAVTGKVLPDITAIKQIQENATNLPMLCRIAAVPGEMLSDYERLVNG